MMKMLVAFFLCGLAATLSAQTTLQTFTSPDGMFQFKYSDLLVRCSEEEHQDWLWIPLDSCNAYNAVCDDHGSQGSTTVVCLAYPKAKFKDHPTFEAAAFSVAEIKEARREDECLNGSPDWVIHPRGSRKTASINHVKFKVFETSDAGMSHYLNGQVYRNFHRNKCYELSVRMASTNRAAFDEPVMEFTRKDWNEVNGRLKEPLDSFIFLK